MNKKGFTLIELLVTISVVAMIMGIILPSAIRLSNENNNRIYQEYENMMVEYAKVSPLRNQNVIYLSDLGEMREVIDDECTGYVVINHTSTPVQYKAYISCGTKYETLGYSSLT